MKIPSLSQLKSSRSHRGPSPALDHQCARGLGWFGLGAASYALLILYVTGVLPLIPMVAGWAILIDAPHVLAHLAHLL